MQVINFPEPPAGNKSGRSRQVKNIDGFKYYNKSQIHLLRRTAKDQAILDKTKGKVTFEKNSLIQDAAIEVSNLKKIYGNLVAVNDISFSIRQGEIFAFLGPNGAGKTTTVEIIESIRQPTAGDIKILGRDIKTSFNSVKEKIGILPQEFHSFERLTVRETLEYFSKLYKKQADIDEIINAMDLIYEENKLYK